ncbi:uncharacterized protein HHUB_2246 [Halobacterium hubeiense]|uniref:Uncharacterized protein n=1 Tax=Halobacterium hubeiense TaxID=1407499 RepID=A0A0U5H2T6_9EURY|nr:hypothetical protein [Halobacterium hubeiense]CQH55543.1 uncharacterized protein HHUB_2246 [Halobacterium hubeiense]
MDAAPESRTRTADRRDGLLALVLAQLTLLTAVVNGLNPLGVASLLVVGLPAFVVGLGLLAPPMD